MGIKQVHYNIDKIDKLDANFNLIYGEKSNGKSYQVKHKKAVEHYLETGKRFILLRRWREDISNLWIEQYFFLQTILMYCKQLFLIKLDKEEIIRRKQFPHQDDKDVHTNKHKLQRAE